jgi:protein-disulfide isomerase
MGRRPVGLLGLPVKQGEPSTRRWRRVDTARGVWCLSGWVGLAMLIVGCATAGSASAQTAGLPKFGKGPVQVRLYTDYFCGPCSRMEPKVEDVLPELVRKNAITLTLIDLPVHATTSLYARYFLYILNENKDLDRALKSRAALFEAAKDKIEDKEKLEEFLKKNSIGYKEMDPRPVFAALSALIGEDKVRSTPTLVIVKNREKSVFGGEIDIAKALDQLREMLPKSPRK